MLIYSTSFIVYAVIAIEVNEVYIIYLKVSIC